jgi:hypothetical protein
MMMSRLKKHILKRHKFHWCRCTNYLNQRINTRFTIPMKNSKLVVSITYDDHCQGFEFIPIYPEKEEIDRLFEKEKDFAGFIDGKKICFAKMKDAKKFFKKLAIFCKRGELKSRNMEKM